MDRLYNDYDHEKGRKHNVYALMKYSNLLCKRGCVSEPINFWAKTFIFDAIIGNTDRHQENWGIIENKRFEKILSARFSPAFDNGTSLGHEIMETKLKEFADPNRILTYIKKGKHHVKWHLKESKQCGHFELITRFIEKYPSSRETILDCLKFDEEELKKYVYELSEFDVKDKISEERCQFVVNLILKRREIISEALSI